MKSGKELRNLFLDYFKDKNHTIVKSSPLIPEDPTLLFTVAGMVQFKQYFSGINEPPYKRVTSCQKCLRVGGKASDLENVGKTIRHHTFFEMLGNFSFKDYFKEDAIKWAWEFLTEIIMIDRKKIQVSVHKSDVDAYNIWKDQVGLSADIIHRLGDKDNFWGPAGGQGACGPSSEIFYDLGPKFDNMPGNCSVLTGCNRYVEVWNLVFPEFDQSINGRRKPLKNSGIDTGMGLERLAMIVQGKKSNYETDLFYPIIEEIQNITGREYRENLVEMRIITDHIRALVSAISESIYPSNDGRGYVLRRLLRRAVRQLNKLGWEEPILYKLVSPVVDILGDIYPEIKERYNQTSIVIKSEEEKFFRSLKRGLFYYEDMKKNVLDKKKKVLDGKSLFILYDTYGFPMDLLKVIVEDDGLVLDEAGFEKELIKAKEIAKASSKFKDEGKYQWVYFKKGKSKFTGYDTLEGMTKIYAYRIRGKEIDIVLAETPFYAESGGQVGDSGRISGSDWYIDVRDTQKSPMGFVHIGKLSGELKNESVYSKVDTKKRFDIARNHTATHLLHSTLRKVLGDHINQEGSFVSDNKTRFDFSHPLSLSKEEIYEVERMINKKILENIPISIDELPIDEAKKTGAISLFGEKYGETVRIVSIGDFSKEFCGGTHLKNTGEIGLFRIINESAVASGIRRVECITGFHAYEKALKDEETIESISDILSYPQDKIEDSIVKLLNENINLKNLSQQFEDKILKFKLPDVLNNKGMYDKITIIPYILDFGDKETAKKLMDILKEMLKNRYIILIGNVISGNPYIVIRVSNDVKNRINAKKLAKYVSGFIKGGGGGSDEMAECGGRYVEGMKEAFDNLFNYIITDIRHKQ
jgi:alanyl-tRNA synthetase